MEQILCLRIRTPPRSTTHPTWLAVWKKDLLPEQERDTSNPTLQKQLKRNNATFKLQGAPPTILPCLPSSSQPKVQLLRRMGESDQSCAVIGSLYTWLYISPTPQLPQRHDTGLVDCHNTSYITGSPLPGHYQVMSKISKRILSSHLELWSKE